MTVATLWLAKKGLGWWIEWWGRGVFSLFPFVTYNVDLVAGTSTDIVGA